MEIFVRAHSTIRRAFIFWGVGAKKTADLQGEDELAPLLPQIAIYTKETIVLQGISNSAESASWKTGNLTPNQTGSQT
jgi:hypothetical protein